MKLRSWLVGCAGVVLLAILGSGIWAWPTIRDLYRAGLFDTLGTRKYVGTVTKNLAAVRTALMLYHDSEGAFPDSSGWMDAIKDRIRPDDLSGEEAGKKLIDPAYAGQAGKFGFAMNDAASKKYKDDIKDPKTILIFESSDTRWNAHGDPSKLAPHPEHRGGNYGITVKGDIVRMP